MHDVIIIGGSFAGLAAATQLGRARRDVVVLDTSEPRNRFAPHSHGFFSRDGAPPLEMLATAREQLGAYRTVAIRNARAVGANKVDGGFDVELQSGDRLGARRLILAHGMVDDLSVLPPGAADCWGRSVFFCPYCHGFEFADRKLGLLLRHGDALMLANLYREWSKDLTIFTDGAAIDDAVRQTLTGMGVKVIDDTVLAFEHEAGDLRALATGGGSVAVDALFTHPPTRFATDIGVQLGCETKDGALGPFFATSEWKETNVEGVLAAGDIARPAPNVSFAVADGVAAGSATHRSLLG